MTGTQAPEAGTEANDTSRSRPRGPSVKPALAVVGIAAFLLLAFGIGSIMTSTPRGTARPGAVRSGGLSAARGAVALRPIERPGTPPADVLGSLVVPRSSQQVSAKPWDGATQYSASMRFELAASQGAVVGFFHSELRARGWSIVSVGAAHGQADATEVLAQRPSSDGWYWEIGAVVSPTRFSSPGAGSRGAETTRFTLELFEVPDSQ